MTQIKIAAARAASSAGLSPLQRRDLEVAAHPPANAAESQEFAAALQAFQSSVAALQAAAGAGDAAAAKQAVNGLKGPYVKLFLKFG